MGKFFDDLPHPPTTLEELQGAVADIPQEFIDNAIASMMRRMQDCIRERGSPIFNFLFAELL
jgi:hypothetical protein